MNESTERETGQGQREALKESARKAARQQPQNYKDKATDEKQVEIGPDVTDAPIKGIDPAESGSGSGGHQCRSGSA